MKGPTKRVAQSPQARFQQSGTYHNLTMFATRERQALPSVFQGAWKAGFLLLFLLVSAGGSALALSGSWKTKVCVATR